MRFPRTTAAVILLLTLFTLTACGSDDEPVPAATYVDTSAVRTCMDRETMIRVDDSLCPETDDDSFWLVYAYMPYYYLFGAMVPAVGHYSTGGTTTRPVNTVLVKAPVTGRTKQQYPPAAKPPAPVVKAPAVVPVRPAAPAPAAPKAPAPPPRR